MHCLSAFLFNLRLCRKTSRPIIVQLSIIGFTQIVPFEEKKCSHKQTVGRNKPHSFVHNRRNGKMSPTRMVSIVETTKINGLFLIYPAWHLHKSVRKVESVLDGCYVSELYHLTSQLLITSIDCLIIDWRAWTDFSELIPHILELELVTFLDCTDNYCVVHLVRSIGTVSGMHKN